MSLLRTIPLFNKTAAQSVEAFPCTLADFDGDLVSGAAGLYLQFHDKATAAAANDVPIKSFYISSAGPTPLASIFQLIGPLTFTKGLSIGISTVPEKYTAATATFNLSVDIEENFADSEGVQGLTLITDTNNTLVLQQANLPKRVFSLSIAANEGVPVVYPMLFNVAATPDGIYPMIELSPIANGITKVYYFGVNGFTFPNPALAGSVVLSSTPTVLTGTLALASPMVGKVKT